MEFVANQLYWPVGDIISSAHEVSPTADTLPFLLGACIVLNCPLVAHDIVANLFAKFQSRICADGGSNIIFDTFPGVVLEPSLSVYMPDAIVGDLDSIRIDVKEFFGKHGVVIQHVMDQDTTDLDKALKYFSDSRKSDSTQFVVILGTVGSHEGRIDQFFAVLNSMYLHKASSMRLISVGNEALMIVLDAGRHLIQVPTSAIDRSCGVVPMFGAVERVETSGLEWNLDGIGLAFGAVVSTNNIIREEVVSIHTSHALLFTFTYR